MSAPRLTIVTNAPVLAVRYVLGVDVAPEWCRVITSAEAVTAMPAESRYIGVFFETRKYRSPLEWALIERRKRGDIFGLGLAEIDGLAAWSARLAPEADSLRVSSMRIADRLEGAVR